MDSFSFALSIYRNNSFQGDRHSQRETETATIESVSGDGQTLTLVDPVEWEHISVTNIFDGNHHT